MNPRPLCDTLTAEEITDRLDAIGLGQTEPRRRSVELILQREGQFRAADLVDQAQPLGIGRVTDFRLFDQLAQMGSSGASTVRMAAIPSRSARRNITAIT